MKSLLTFVTAILMVNIGFSQEIEKTLRPFDKIVVSPQIDLMLVPGETESIRITYSGVDAGDIIVDQSRNRVHVYLQGYKIYDKGIKRGPMFDRRPKYRYAKVTAYVTFKALKLIEIRGDGEVLCDGNIISKKLKVRAYGDNDVRLAYVDAAVVKARLYGDNTMKIRDGNAGHLNFKLYGDNKVDSHGMRSVTSSTSIYGDGIVRMYVTGEVRLNSFGDPSLFVSGSGSITKGLVFGSADIRRN